MTLPDRKMVLSAAFGLALAAAPTSPAVAQEPAPLAKTDASAIVVDDLKRDVEQMRKDVILLKQAQRDTDEVLNGQAGGEAGGLARTITGMESRLAAVEDAMARIEKRLDALSKTTAGSSPLGGGDPVRPTISKATIRLVNEYQTEISLILNGVSYRLGAGEVRSVEVSSGSYSYELLAAGSKSRTSTVKDGETVTLRIR